MSFEEWWTNYLKDNPRLGFPQAFKNVAKDAWQDGYQVALDGWVNHKSKKE